ncbi:rRNA maturation RNase YbeY [Candidatus Poriferisocius sp.]|uniref:rRNA maturation RNase YbeY n=1 Tax=Candidatus Poriferisocius sp. TaxID=3101276 RepID=UPI003B026A68
MGDSDGGPSPAESDSAGEVVVVSDRQRDLLVAQERWAGLLHRVLAEEQVAAPWEAGLSFVAADEMASLNAEHRGIDKPTDVLAFGADDGSAPRAADEPRLVGDVVICPSVAASNAAAHGKAVDDELALLVVHGTLHLLGYDHVDDNDARLMEGREQELLTLASAGDALAGSRAGAP